MADETIRVGFVGAGGNTRLRHLPGLQAIDGVETVSVSNRSRASSQRVAGDFGLSAIYDSWVDLIEAPDTNAICIGTWPYMHATLTIAALESGKHVLCEARMAMNASEAHDMLDASNANPGLVTQIVPAPHTLKVGQQDQGADRRRLPGGDARGGHERGPGWLRRLRCTVPTGGTTGTSAATISCTWAYGTRR